MLRILLDSRVRRPAVLALVFSYLHVAAGAVERPNFVLIYCDDLGYGDIGCFGSTKHRTPNIDRMASEGLVLTSFYVTSGVCTPSRSSLMTGCYPRRVNMHVDGKNGWVLFPRARKGLNPTEITVAEVLKTRGYATACVGKWHLGDQPEFLPTRQGFDSYLGIPYSNDMQVKRRGDPPLPLLRDEKVIDAPVDQTTLTKRYTKEAIAFIEKYKERPFFLYLPHAMPHNPVHSSERFRGKSANGGYGDCVEEIDWSTGEILATIDRLGINRRTLVIFTSDNGAAKRWGGSNGSLRGWKGSTNEGGQRVCFVARWPGTIAAGSESAGIVSTLDILPTFAALAGAKLPENPIDGVDVSAVFRGGESPRREFLYYFRERLEAVREGRFKLALPVKRGRQKKPSPAALYDLEADIAESRDVAKAHPDVVERLLALAEKARAELGDGEREGAGQRKAGWVKEAKPLLLAK